MPNAPRLVLVRHGQSAWNRTNRFTGWENPPLTPLGRREADRIGGTMANAGIVFDAAYTSYLSRAIETLWRIQKAMDLMWIPVQPDWRLNERHYGALQGLDKTRMCKKYGAQRVQEWRRSYQTPPPLGGKAPASDHRYADVQLPQGESLADTRVRAAACFKSRLLPELKTGKRLLIVSHGNLLRALMMQIENLSATDIVKVQIPTAHAVAYHRIGGNGMPQPPRKILSPAEE